MPNITIDVENTQETIARQVTLCFAYDIISALGLPNSTRIFYPGTDNEEDLPITTPWTEQNYRFPPSLKVLLRAEEDYVPDSLMANTLERVKSNPPIFIDDGLNIYITPVYAPVETTLTLQIRFDDRSSAIRTRDLLRRNASRSADGLMHEVNYRYLVPRTNTAILEEIHRCRESQEPLNESLGQYFTRCFTKRMLVTANLNKSHKAMNIQEKQVGILGRFEFDVSPDKPDPNETTQTYTLTLNYRARYDRVIATTMTYPFIVHNVPIDSRYYDQSIHYQLGFINRTSSEIRYLLDRHTTNNQVKVYADGVPIPYFDDWYPSAKPLDIEGMLRVLCVVNPDNRRALFNLQEIPDIEFRDHMLDYMLQEHDNLNKYRHSAVFVGLYEDGVLLEGDKVVVDDELNITTTFDMDLKKTYRVYVGVYTHWKNLVMGAYERLRKQGEIAFSILVGIEERLISENLIPDTLSDGSVRRVDLDKALDFIRAKRQRGLGFSQHPQFRVGHFIVVATN